ncbi:hypothetical protein JB92DRAFT_2860206 [Gautieria morchelliformis]|nr:hypothetical protein JB92DRAFT_2860206 [Gautieria morchelliformis]
MRDTFSLSIQAFHSPTTAHKVIVQHVRSVISHALQVSNTSHIPSVRSTLARMSSTLQMLHSASGIDSLLLAVSPHPMPPPTTSSATVNTDSETHQNSAVPPEPYEASWIGGTDLGKEFWTGLKGGGVNGARAFRVKCQMRREAEICSPDLDTPTPMASSNPVRPNLARTSDPDRLPIRSSDVKTELNAAVRHALRSASGNPSAEMRWTKPASLEELYNVRLVGWPPDVKMRNPSNNTSRINRLLLDLIRNGNMKFVQRGSLEWIVVTSATVQQEPILDDSAVLPTISSVAPAGENPPIAPSHAPAVDSLQFPTLPVNPMGTAEGSSQSPSHVPDRLCYPSSLHPPGPTGDGTDVSTSIPRPTLETSAAVAGSMAPKRPVEDNYSERETQEAREAKRVKLDSALPAG